MAKGGQSKPVSAKQKSSESNIVDAAALQAEVKSFASGLGLVAAGIGSGFDDTDFRPPNAEQKSKFIANKPNTESADKRNVPKRKAQTDRQSELAPAQPPAETPDVVRERNWNAGVGPRPGEKQGHSLLARDSPSLWYEAAAALAPLPRLTGAAAAATVTETEFEAKKQAALAALQNEETVFERDLGRKNGQDARWLQQVRRSGTTSDKVAALTLLLQESAVANLRSLDALLNWVIKRKGGRNVVAQAIDALKEIFLVALLPDRKLKFFEQQPLAAVPANKEGTRRLLFYYVEDCLKKRYSSFVTGLEECSRDNLEFLKDKALKAMFDLLRSKPEQEGKLLSGVVNKLGDPSRKVASKAGYLLTSLLQEHPAMKVVVVAEVQRFMFRQGLQERARYYGVIFLNQMVLSHHASQGGSDLAKRLIDIYFTLFKLILEGHIGRAAAAAKEQEAKLPAKSKDRHRDRAGGRGRGRGGRGGSQGRGPSAPPEPKKPLAEEVDARILSAIIAGVRRAFPFVATDDVQPLIERHSDALFKMIHTAPFGVAVQALLLLFQLMAAQSAVSDRFYRALYAVLLHPEVARSGKSPMFLSLLFKAMKGDVSTKRVAAFAKRLLQVAQEQQPAFTCGCLLMLSEILKGKPSLWTLILEAEDNEDDVERFQDMPESPTHNSDFEAAQASDAEEEADDVRQQQFHSRDKESDREVAEDQEEEEGENGDMAPSTSGQGQVEGGEGPLQGSAPAGLPGTASKGYDMRKRQPEFSGGDRSCWWELTCLGGHVHPSVAAFARTLLAGTYVAYDGDPLRDLTLTAFLDKFVQRKPKAQAKGTSLMQPLIAPAKPQTPSRAQIGSAAFAAMAESDVAPDAQFFHKYYSLASVKSKGKKKRKRGDEGDSDEAEEFSESDSELDDILDAEEVYDDAPESGHAYADLAAAMGDEEDSDQDDEEEEEQEGAELGSDVDDDDLDLVSDEEDDLDHSDMDNADSADEGSDMDDPDHSDQQADNPDDDNLNPFELAEATDSDDKPKQKGKGKKKRRKVEAWDDISDDSDSEAGSNEADWVMHQTSKPESAQGQTSARLSIPKKSKGMKSKKPSGGLDAFASADDYLHQIETDLASMPADVTPSSGNDQVKGPLGTAGKRNNSTRKNRQQKSQ